MSLKVNGKLYVQTRTGRFGPFNIAKLATEIGDFAIKDKAVEELDEGAYSGAFVIGQVFLSTTRLPNGGVITELRARVDDYALLDDGAVPEDISVGADEQDPIMEEEAPPEAPVDCEPADQVKEVFDSSDAEDSVAPALFGEIWPLGETVFLDPAIDRMKFRQQRDYLKANGYKYVSDRKVWTRVE